MATKKFKCTVCGYIHEGDTAPSECPVCHAPSSKFEELKEENGGKKKGLNTNGNAYTIIYASILVIVVAFLLAFVSSSLKPIQDVNVAIDKKQQILAALNIRDLKASDVEAQYDKVVTADEIINAKGDVINKGEKKDKAAFGLDSKTTNADNLALYVCNVEGEPKYVIPVYGRGLWGPIWGYVALNADKNTVYGTYFSHESETAGLGARITEYEGFQKQFEGKKVMNDGAKTIELSVLKKGKTEEGVQPANQCDGITGATLTSNGVNNMLHDCLKMYTDFLTAK